MLHKKIAGFGAIAAVLFSLIPVLAGPAVAQSAAADDAKRRVNIAGRQRMLSQRMSKAACFILTGVEVDTHRNMLNGAFNLFSTSHEALRYGSEDPALIPEINTKVLVALGEVDGNWENYANELSPIMGGRKLMKRRCHR